MADQFGSYAGQYRNDYTREQNARFAAEFSELTAKFAQAMGSGTPATDDSVQNLVAEHYAFCRQFWEPTRAAYKSLAMSYILPSPYRDTYESVAEGLGKYHYDAIVTWADRNLSS
jgi:hypothetical protein